MSPDPAIVALSKVAAQIDTLRAEIVPRLDRIEERIYALECQNRKAARRLGDHDVAISRLQEHDKGQEKTEAAITAANDVWFRRLSWGIGLAFGTIIAGIGWVIGSM